MTEVRERQRCPGPEKRNKGFEEQKEVECSWSIDGPWWAKAQAKEGHHHPIHKDHGLDPAGRRGNCLLVLCMGVTPDLHFKKIALAYIFLIKKITFAVLI